MSIGKLFKAALKEVGKAVVDGLLRRGEKRIGQHVKVEGKK